MKKRISRFSVVVAIGGALMLLGACQQASAVILLDDHFDNNDISTGGTNGGFVTISNGAGGDGTVAESGTLATVTNSADASNYTGLVSNNSINSTANAGTGFTMTFVVDSVSGDPQANGMFLGLKGDGTSFLFPDPGGNFGLTLSSNAESQSGTGFSLNWFDVTNRYEQLAKADFDVTSIQDGFTAEIFMASSGWEYQISDVTSSGFPASFHGSGSWGTKTYDAQLDGADFIWTGAQGNLEHSYDRITVETGNTIVPLGPTTAELTMKCFSRK